MHSITVDLNELPQNLRVFIDSRYQGDHIKESLRSTIRQGVSYTLALNLPVNVIRQQEAP